MNQITEEFKNLLIIGLTIAIVILLGGVGYVSQTKELVPKNQIVKTNTSPKEISFDDLAPSIQNRYILRDTHLDQMSQYELEKEQLLKQLEKTTEKPKDHSLLEKTALMQKEKDLQIIEESEKLKLETTDTPKNYKTYTCKSFEHGSIVVPSECKKNLYEFIDKHKTTAKFFELIGMVDGSEFKLIRKLEDVYGSSEVKEVKKYVQIGLSRQRVIEITWLANEKLKDDVALNIVNYTIHTDDKRGFIIRAYY